MNSESEPTGWYFTPISHCLPSVGFSELVLFISAPVVGWNDADVGRHAIVEDVAERRVAAELLVAAGIGGVALL